MKFDIKRIGGYMLVATALLSGFALQSCEDEPDKFELTGGKPTIYYIRPTDVDQKDSLLVQSYPESSICIVGSNLTSIKEMYFNDKQAILNTSYITDHTLVVSVPKDIPDKVTDKIYMVTTGNDTVKYDFHVVVPAPTLTSMSCEYVHAGDEVTINGSYFIDDPGTPIKVTLPDGQEVTDFVSKSRSALTFVMPECDTEGPVSVTSVYGTTKSSFRYLDSRGLLFDFDGKTGLMPLGWHSDGPVVTDTDNPISGKYIQIGNDATTMSANGDWNDNTYFFPYWPGEWTTPVSYVARQSQKLTDLADFTNYQNMAYKFEMYVPKSNPWSAGAMQIIVGGVDKISGTGSGLDVDGKECAGANNTYFNNDDLPRGIYRPWESTGSFDTDGKWITVTLPIKDFTYGMSGSKASGNVKLTADDFTSFTIFIVGGGISGTECKPVIRLDNIRVVPLN